MTNNIEQHFEKLEEIIEKMEEQNVTLDESFELYKLGLDEVKKANSMLNDMEKEMLVLNPNGQLEEF